MGEPTEQKEEEKETIALGITALGRLEYAGDALLAREFFENGRMPFGLPSVGEEASAVLATTANLVARLLSEEALVAEELESLGPPRTFRGTPRLTRGVYLVAHPIFINIQEPILKDLVKVLRDLLRRFRVMGPLRVEVDALDQLTGVVYAAQDAWDEKRLTRTLRSNSPQSLLSRLEEQPDRPPSNRRSGLELRAITRILLDYERVAPVIFDTMFGDDEEISPEGPVLAEDDSE